MNMIDDYSYSLTERTLAIDLLGLCLCGLVITSPAKRSRAEIHSFYAKK